MPSGHFCKNGEWSEGDSGWEVYDAQNIYLCRVCEKCENEKLSRYRPEILTGYDQLDVDESIEEE